MLFKVQYGWAIKVWRKKKSYTIQLVFALAHLVMDA